MKTIAVILTGCGYKDGSEITEAVSTLIALSHHNINYECFAPNIDYTSTNHINGNCEEARNTLTESARISRGKIHELNQLNVTNFDAVVIPGGYGAALHLSDWASKGSQCSVNSEFSRIIKEFHQQSKPIAAICIAPAIIAKILASESITVTIGDDQSTAEEINKTGAEAIDCPVSDYISDRESKVLTTPAYMFENAKPSDVYLGISKLIKELVEMA